MAARRKSKTGRTAKKAANGKAKTKRAPRPKTPAQLALELTWLLKGKLKSARMAYLRIGEMLAQVRDQGIYKDLHHDNIEAYADQRLNLGKSSLYQYLQVYDWAREFHPEWLEPKPQGFIPEFSDANDLMWIERKLKAEDLAPETRTKLEALRDKGLQGKLRKRDLAEFRAKSNPAIDGLKSYLSRLRGMRRIALRLKQMPEEAIPKLDAFIEVIENALTVQKADTGLPEAA